MKVDFMLVGAQKSGTTSLALQLSQHPKICFCDIKEPGFFNTTPDWEAQLDSYHQLYKPQPGQLCGEASTMYTFLPEWPETAVRLHRYNPDLKLIYMMRQPVERTLSNYTHNFVRNIDKQKPEKAIFADPGYINRSRYFVQLKPYLELFSRDNILLLIFEEYIANQVNTLAQIASFLQISATEFAAADTRPKHRSVGETYLKHDSMRKAIGSSFFQSIRDYIPASIRQPIRRRLSNRLDEKPDFSPELRRLIWRFVEEDVCQVEQLLNRRLPIWREDFV